jgi:chorismate synthase
MHLNVSALKTTYAFQIHNRRRISWSCSCSHHRRRAAGLPIDKAKIDHELWRRQQGYGRGGRMKIETDTIQILSGVRHGKALGSPIALMIENRDFVHWTDIMSAEEIETQPKNPRIVKRPRPGHADLAGGQKYQARDLRNILERASARETAARVAAGAVRPAAPRVFWCRYQKSRS